MVGCYLWGGFVVDYGSGLQCFYVIARSGSSGESFVCGVSTLFDDSGILGGIFWRYFTQRVIFSRRTKAHLKLSVYLFNKADVKALQLRNDIDFEATFSIVGLTINVVILAITPIIWVRILLYTHVMWDRRYLVKT